jgi:hypothetical protein
MNPRARRRGLLVRDLPDEVLVYDQQAHRAHCLNRTAALVFLHADGSRSVDELARLVGDGARRELVGQTLAQLDEAGLLETPVLEDELQPAGMERRAAVRRMGIAAAILLPAVVSIVAPTPAEAAATCVANCAGQPFGTPCDHCGNGTQCATATSSCDGAGNCSDLCPPN